MSWRSYAAALTIVHIIFYSFTSFHFDRSKAPRVTTTRDVELDDVRGEAINRRGRRRRETRDDILSSSSPQLYVIAVVLITSLFLEHYIGTMSTQCTLRRTITVRNAKIAVFRPKENPKNTLYACGKSIVNEVKGAKGTRVEIFGPRQTSRNTRVRLAIFIFFFLRFRTI